MDITYDKLKKYAETALNNEMQSVVAGRDKNSYKFIDLSIYATKQELEETTSDILTKEEAATLYLPVGDYATKQELEETTSDILTKEEAATLYLPVGDYATKQELEETTSDILTKEEAATLYLPVGDYATTDDVDKRLKYIDLITNGTAPLHLSSNFSKSDDGDCTIVIDGYIDEATSELSGLMSAEDKRKLDTLYETYITGGTTVTTYQVIIDKFTINNGEMISSDGGEYTAQASFGLYEYENGILTNIYLNEDGLNISSNSDWITTGDNLIINVGNNDGNDRCATLTLTVYITAANGTLYSGTASTYICQEGAEAQVTVTSITCKVETPKYDNISWKGEDTVSVYWDDYAYTIITNYSDGTKTESHSGAEIICMVYNNWDSSAGGTWSSFYSYFNDEPIEDGQLTVHITSSPTEMERDIVYPVCRVAYRDANGELQTADSEAGVIKQNGREEYSLQINSFQYNGGESFPAKGGTFEPQLSVALLINDMISGEISNYSTSYNRRTSSYTTNMQCTFDTNTGVFVVEENTNTHELDGGTVYVSVSYTAPDGTELTDTSSVLITQEGAEVAYGDITAEVSYDTVAYSGGTVSPTITYEQPWTRSDGTSGVITEGATVKCTGITMPAKYSGTTSGYNASVDSDGMVTISGHSTLGDTWLCFVNFNISLNGVSTDVTGYVYQETEDTSKYTLEINKFSYGTGLGYITYAGGSELPTIEVELFKDGVSQGLIDDYTFDSITCTGTISAGTSVDNGMLHVSKNTSSEYLSGDVHIEIEYTTSTGITVTSNADTIVTQYPFPSLYITLYQYNGGNNIPAEGGTFEPELGVGIIYDGAGRSMDYSTTYSYYKSSYTDVMSYSIDTSTGVLTVNENTRGVTLSGGRAIVYVSCTINDDELTVRGDTYLNQD